MLLPIYLDKATLSRLNEFCVNWHGGAELWLTRLRKCIICSLVSDYLHKHLFNSIELENVLGVDTTFDGHDLDTELYADLHDQVETALDGLKVTSTALIEKITIDGIFDGNVFILALTIKTFKKGIKR